MSDGALLLDGFSQTVGSLDNAGAVSFGGSAPGTTLTVAGDYVGNGGTVYLGTVLGDDNSDTDLLNVLGSTSGSSTLAVTNVGGTGAPTEEGIQIVEVGGTSAGTFNLRGDYVFEGDQAVVGGAYAYRLYQGSVTNPADGNWYLRSSLIDDPGPAPAPEPLYQPGVPVYEAYANVLQSFQKLDTLQQRVGNRSWSGAESQSVEGDGLWARIIADHTSIDPDASTADVAYDVNSWRLQAGADGIVGQSEAGILVGGLNAEVGRLQSSISSPHGDGSISSLAFGGGATLTFYGDTGFYLDGQASVKVFDSSLTSGTSGLDLVEGNRGVGYALSLEAGQKVVVTEGFSLTPQAQLTYSSVALDTFTDTFGARVSFDNGETLVGRLGLSADFESTWRNEAGEAVSSHVYGVANLYYDFSDGTQTNVAGTTLVNTNDPLWGGLGVGGSLSLGEGDSRHSIYGEALVNTSLGNFGDSYSVGATVGFRGQW